MKIQIENLSFSYAESAPLLKNIGFTLDSGRVISILGPNGAGKTTTLKMITGILAPSEGTIEINGKDIQKDPLEAKRQFGFVPDDPDAFLRVRGAQARLRPGR